MALSISMTVHQEFLRGPFLSDGEEVLIKESKVTDCARLERPCKKKVRMVEL